ncbi:uncharacterized protein [Notamacropus eugenii]|uniref:uncharacterized protein isoform X2 n=2 Tax=Notamacropus eugenii TaxID=9315 RepID=UPI003B684704
MNASPAPGTGSRSEGNNARPFFYTQPTAQPPFPNPWYLNPLYNPYCVSAAGFRNGNPYVPYYSVALHEYPGFLMPQAPVPTRVNRRPYFHPQPSYTLFQHAAHFCHYSSPGKKTETKETQTDPQQPESKFKKQVQKLDSNGCNSGRMTNAASEKKTTILSSPVQEREVHGKSPSSTTMYRNIPSGNYAFEKEEIRIEYGDGSPAIQLWKSFKETIPIYDLTHGKTAPENIVQCDLFPLSSCERIGVLYTPHKGEEMPTIECSEEDKDSAMLTKQYPEGVQDKEVQMPGPSLEGSLDKDKERVATQKFSTPLHTANQWQPNELNRSGKKVHSVASPSLSVLTPNRSTQKLNQQAESVCSSMEAINGSSQEPPSPSRQNGQTKLRDGFWSNELGEFNPTPTWLARFEKIDASIHPLPQRKSPSVSSVEPSSRSEESSLDNVPMTDLVLEKNMYGKSTEGTGQESEIQDDYYNEEEEGVMMVGEVGGIVDRDTKMNSSRKLKEHIKRGREQEDLSRYPTQKTCSFKEKESLSDPDSEDLWGIEGEEIDGDKDLDEAEYIFEAVDPRGDLTPSNENFYQEIGHRVIWKPSHTTASPQLIVWPVKTKDKSKSGDYESIPLFHKLKDRDYYETACGELLKKRMVVKRKVKLDRPKRKMLRKHKDMKPETEAIEVWTVPKRSIPRGYGLRKSSYRK